MFAVRWRVPDAAVLQAYEAVASIILPSTTTP
jgi:hypothetical protein